MTLKEIKDKEFEKMFIESIDDSFLKRDDVEVISDEEAKKVIDNNYKKYKDVYEELAK